MSDTSASTGAGTGTSASTRLAIAVVATCTAANALYALLRVGQKLLFPEPDPALVLWSEHAGYFWRAWIAFYAGATAGFAAWVASRRDAARVARVLATALVVSTILIAVQGVLVP